MGMENRLENIDNLFATIEYSTQQFCK